MFQILIVDDNPIDRKIASRVLGVIENAELHTACSGEEAFEMLTDDHFDLVITDLRMPGIDGLMLLNRIREEFDGLPVVMMTAEGSEEMAIEALRNGASNYVAKHEMARDLIPIAESLLKSGASRRERRTILAAATGGRVTFQIPSDREMASKLARHLQDAARFGLCCDGGTRTRVGVAFEEALLNAVIHGNLEVSSELRERGDNSFNDLIAERQRKSPYRDRKVDVVFEWSDQQIEVVIRDEGNGFKLSELPDPTDPMNLLKPSGRGVLLMKSFMDEVSFNEKGNEVRLVKRTAAHLEPEVSAGNLQQADAEPAHILTFAAS